MADSSFEIDYHSTGRSRNYHQRRQLRHPSTPVNSQYDSRSFTQFSFTNTPNRLRQTPSTPFATDNDTSWQDELSWQFQPIGWNDTRSLGAALSPWAASTPSNRHIFQRSANDYYLSRTHGGFRTFTNPYYDQSSYGAVPAGRLELQSYAARNNERSVVHVRDYSSAAYSKSHHGISRPISQAIKGGARRNASPLVDQDELSMIDYDSEDVEKQGELLQTDTNLHGDKDSRWISVSHAYMEDDGVSPLYHSTPHGGHDHHGHELSRSRHDDLLSAYEANRSTSRDYVPGKYPYDDIDQASEYEDEDYDEEDDDNEEAARREVGLFSLFKYSTKWDMVLVFLGCLGALINGGSLPWYSYFFGDFVNRIAKHSDDNMMKEVERVSVFICVYTISSPSTTLQDEFFDALKILVSDAH